MGSVRVYVDRDGFDKMETGLGFVGCREVWGEEMFERPIMVDESKWRVEDVVIDSTCRYVVCHSLNGDHPDERAYEDRLRRRMGLR